MYQAVVYTSPTKETHEGVEGVVVVSRFPLGSYLFVVTLPKGSVAVRSRQPALPRIAHGDRFHPICIVLDPGEYSRFQGFYATDNSGVMGVR